MSGKIPLTIIIIIIIIHPLRWGTASTLRARVGARALAVRGYAAALSKERKREREEQRVRSYAAFSKPPLYGQSLMDELAVVRALSSLAVQYSERWPFTKESPMARGRG